MILHAVHPVPVVRIPAGRRKERLDFERTATCVEVPEATASETDDADPVLLGDPQVRGDRTPVLYEGRLFRPMGEMSVNAGAADLASLLCDGLHPGCGGAAWLARLRFHLKSSPLFAPHRNPDRSGIPVENFRGEELGPHRSVRRHVGETAAQAVREFASECLLLVDGVPHFRVVPLAAAARTPLGIAVRISCTRGLVDLDDLPCAPDGLDALLAAQAGTRPVIEFGNDPTYRAWIDLPATVFGDRAARMAANRAPSLLRAERNRWLPDRTPEGWTETEGFEIDGLASIVHGEAVETALAACAANARAMLATGHRWVNVGKVPAALRVFEDVYMPAYAASAYDGLAEDAPAFANLAP